MNENTPHTSTTVIPVAFVVTPESINTQSIHRVTNAVTTAEHPEILQVRAPGEITKYAYPPTPFTPTSTASVWFTASQDASKFLRDQIRTRRDQLKAQRDALPTYPVPHITDAPLPIGA